MTTVPGPDSSRRSGEPVSQLAHVEQLCHILLDQQETCLQLAECAQEQQDALRLGKGSDFVRASLAQAHLARRFYFLEEERLSAVETLAHALSAEAGPTDLLTVLEKLPEADARRVSAHSGQVRHSAEKAAAVQRVNAQMIQTNIQLAAALTRQVVDPSVHYHAGKPAKQDLPASQLDQRI